MKESWSAEKIITGIIVLGFSVLLILLVRSYNDHSPESPDDNEKQQEALLGLRKVTEAVILYGNKTGKFPKDVKNLTPDFFTEIPLDPYGKQYLLQQNGPNQMLVIYLGKNGKRRGYASRDVDAISTVELKNGKFSLSVQ